MHLRYLCEISIAFEKVVVNTKKIILYPFCFFFDFWRTQATPCGSCPGAPSPSGGAGGAPTGAGSRPAAVPLPVSIGRGNCGTSATSPRGNPIDTRPPPLSMKYTPMKPGQGASPQQCPTGTHTHNSRSGNTGQGTQEYIAPLHNAPIKPHKPRKGAGVLGYTPGTKRRTQGRTGHGKKGIKKPRPQGAGGMYFQFRFRISANSTNGKTSRNRKPIFYTSSHEQETPGFCRFGISCGDFGHIPF